MNRLFATLLFVSAVPAFSTALAAEQSIRLSVPGMNCASCPYIIEMSISAVDGVRSVEAILDDRTATVTFDDAITSVEAITKATASVGYESTVLDQAAGS